MVRSHVVLRQLAAWLQRHLEAVQLDGQLGEWGPEARALVFPNSRGNIGRHSVFMNHVWRPILKAAGLRYRKPHSMRHTFASWALEGNEETGIPPAPILAVRDWMGHASVQEGVPAPSPGQPRDRGQRVGNVTA